MPPLRTPHCGPENLFCDPENLFCDPKNLFCGPKFLFCGPENTRCAADFTRTWHEISRCAPDFLRRAPEFPFCAPNFPFCSSPILRNKLNSSDLNTLKSTADEETAEKALVALVREFQARARQKHFSKTPETLAEYGIGLKISNSRAVLEGWGQTIHDKTATDKLPKVTETKRTALKTALDTYKNTQTGQSGAIGEASGTRIDRNALVEEATERRLWLQFAADAEWPHTAPANTPIRREFQLPATRAFIG